MSINDGFALARRLKTPVWVYDTDNKKIAYANKAACGLWQAASEEELRKRDLSQGMSAAVSKRLKQYQTDFAASDSEFSEVWTIYPNGEPRTLNVVYTGFKMPDGRMAMMCETMGEEAEQPETLRSAEALLHTDVMIALFSLEGVPLYLNPAARNSLPEGFARFEEIFVHRTEFLNMQHEVLQGDESQKVAKVHSNMGKRWYDFSVKRCLDAATGDAAVLVTCFDVTDLKEARDQARFLADRDQLTGCYNRTFFAAHMDALSKHEIGQDSEHALLFMDIDHFKNVNDTFGHEIGDKVLNAFAQRVRSKLNPADVIARLGGDEFLVFLAVTGGRENLIARVEEIQGELARPIDCGAIDLSVTSSIGVAEFKFVDGVDWSAKMKSADIALYSSKRTGRSCYTIYDEEFDAAATRRAWLEAEIYKALAANTFEVHYQPRQDIKTGTIVAAEALIRWKHAEQGYISPTEFIPVCEEIGVIDKVGAFVLDRVCDDLNKWYNLGAALTISVNVSPNQFQSAEFVACFEEIAAGFDFPPKYLELELTESSLAGADENIAQKMEQITDLGFRIALDDFGTGYSNLAHITKFPLHCIKLDMSFVQQLPSSGPLLNLIFALARQVEATTVAEGVETQAQLDWLRKSPCDQMQGFHFHRAMPGMEFYHLLCNREELQVVA